jgi:hypothetical protein
VVLGKAQAARWQRLGAYRPDRLSANG